MAMNEKDQNNKIKDLLNRANHITKITDFEHKGATVILHNSFSRPVISTALQAMIHAYDSERKHTSYFTFTDYLSKKRQLDGAQINGKIPLNLKHNLEQQNAKTLFNVISDKRVPEIKLNKFDAIQIDVAVSRINNLLKKDIPKNNSQIMKHVRDGISDVAINNCKANISDIKKYDF